MQKMIDENKLHLVIGEPLPGNSPKEFSDIVLYTREDDNSLKIYAEVSLPYLINYAEFFNEIEGDPRYFFEEDHSPDGKSCKYRCELQPLGERAGVYRLGFNYPIKIRSIEPICKNTCITDDSVQKVLKKVDKNSF